LIPRALRGRSGIYAVAAALLAVAIVLAAFRIGDEPGALSDWQALALGIVQGLTELLPISSSGHLILVPWLADWRYLETNDEFNQTFDVALHFGTLVAVAAYFRREIGRLIAAWLRSVRRRRVEAPDERLAWVVAIATVPAAAVGAAGEGLIAEHLGEPWQIAIFLAVFGIVLWLADRRPQRRELTDVRYGEALAVGFAQALALAPGVSRSGITISAARFLGLDRDAAARLSFLLLVPIVFGATLLEGVTSIVLGDLPAGWGGPFLVGVLAAAASGLVAIDILLGYVRRHDYSVFVLYRLAVAMLVAGLILGGVRDATF
jgi:undecaprenyl-diphosphatase